MKYSVVLELYFKRHEWVLKEVRHTDQGLIIKFLKIKQG